MLLDLTVPERRFAFAHLIRVKLTIGLVLRADRCFLSVALSLHGIL